MEMDRTDNLTAKQREILDEARAAHRRREDVASVCERLGARHGMPPQTMARLVVNLTLIDRQLELINQGKPAFTNADGEPVLQLPPPQMIKDIANGKPWRGSSSRDHPGRPHGPTQDPSPTRRAPRP